MNTRGFTLVEAMVAVSIMAIAIGAPMYAASRTIAAAQLSADKLTATYLAQEGVEYIRKVRDDAYLQNPGDKDTAWTTFSGSGVGQCYGPELGCVVDTIASKIEQCPGVPATSCQALYRNGFGQYTLQAVSATKTPFVRYVQIEGISSYEIRVVSSVTWQFHGETQTVSVTDHLTAWH